MKYTLIALFFITILFTSSDPHFYDVMTDEVSDDGTYSVRDMPWMDRDRFKPFIMDHDSRVAQDFKVNEYYYPSVSFWFLIYTQFYSSQVVIHDRSDLDIIYKVLDFSNLGKKELNRNARFIIQQKVTDEKIRELKSLFDELIGNPFLLDSRTKSLFRLLRLSGITLPIQKEERINLFEKLKGNLRSQTGQKDFIRAGIINSLPYKKFLEQYFSDRNLPIGLLAVPFLESSFNPRAQSRVGASGPWQFMPLIASYYMPKRSSKPFYDYRNNVGVSSLSAAFLMNENYKIMKSWDLAVTAYNSGTKHLLKTKRKLGVTQPPVNLEAVIENSDSAHFGFASKNFYAEFLALVHTLAYEEEVFNDLHENDRYNMNDDLSFYMAKCSIIPIRVLSTAQIEDVQYYNHHFKDYQARYPKGFIITAKVDLPASKFYKMKAKDLLKWKPKEWDRFIARQSCSTK